MDDLEENIYDILSDMPFIYKPPEERFKEFIDTLTLDECKCLYRSFTELEIHLEQIILLKS